MRRLVLAALLLPALAGAQPFPVHVRVNYSDPGLTAADQAQINAQIQAKFAAVNNLNWGPPPANAKVLTINITNAPGGTLRGLSRKRHENCDVYTRTYSSTPLFIPPAGAAPAVVAATLTRRRNALAETAAHELGHLLCASHTQNAPLTWPAGGRRSYVDHAGVTRTGNGLNLTTMTAGPLVTQGEKGAGGTAFTLLNRSTIQLAVNRLRDGRKDWRLEANFDGIEDRIEVVEGLMPIAFEAEFPEGEAPLHEDPIVDIQVLLEAPVYFGWMNRFGDFYPMVAPGSPPTTIESIGGDPYDFAVALPDAEGEPGQVFRFAEFGQITRVDGPLGRDNAADPGADLEEYYQGMELLFDLEAAGHRPVQVYLTTQNSAGAHGLRLRLGRGVPAEPGGGADRPNPGDVIGRACDCRVGAPSGAPVVPFLASALLGAGLIRRRRAHHSAGKHVMSASQT